MRCGYIVKVFCLFRSKKLLNLLYYEVKQDVGKFLSLKMMTQHAQKFEIFFCFSWNTSLDYLFILSVLSSH